MRIAVYSSQTYERDYLDEAAALYSYSLTHINTQLDSSSALLAKEHDVACVFVNDELSLPVLEQLKQHGVKLIALRCAGFNNVDIGAASNLGLCVTRVPRYSPYAVAEHATALLLTLNRHTHRAWARVREGNFSLNGLVGFDLHGKTVGIVGTGNIGSVMTKIMSGFGCRVLAYDLVINQECVNAGIKYVELDTLYKQADIISLHCPLTPETHHMINDSSIRLMKTGVTLINTSRGAVCDTKALIAALKINKIGYLGLDVYEQEGDLFFKDLSDKVIPDDVFERLLTFPNVLVTGHQGFLTHEALTRIASTTMQNIQDFSTNKCCCNAVTEEHLPR